MRKTLNSLAGLVIGIVVGAALMWAFAPGPEVTHVPVPTRTVPCVTEDSCTVDYRNGAWHIGLEGSANY